MRICLARVCQGLRSSQCADHAAVDELANLVERYVRQRAVRSKDDLGVARMDT
jgi:hypothetical protein